MKVLLIVVFSFSLLGCATRNPYEPIFIDAEKFERSQRFDDWYVNAVKGF